MFALNLRIHNIKCLVSDKSTCAIITNKCPNAPSTSTAQIFSATSELPNSRNVHVSVSGRCREFAIPFGNGAVYPCQVGIRHRMPGARAQRARSRPRAEAHALPAARRRIRDSTQRRRLTPIPPHSTALYSSFSFSALSLARSPPWPLG